MVDTQLLYIYTLMQCPLKVKTVYLYLDAYDFVFIYRECDGARMRAL